VHSFLRETRKIYLENILKAKNTMAKLKYLIKNDVAE